MDDFLPFIIIGIFAGFFTGTFVLTAGAIKNQYGMGMGGFWSCLGAGLLFSFLGSTIVMMVFMWLMVQNSNRQQKMSSVTQMEFGSTEPLKQLRDMFVSGHISAQEYEAKRAGILSRM